MRPSFTDADAGTQQWQIETVNRMIKRNLSDALSSRGYHSHSREFRRRAVVQNIMVSVSIRRFATEYI